jgi:hypothetical protein
MILTGETRRIWRKNCPSATLFTPNPTWTDPSMNPGLCGKRLATNQLSHGTALGNIINHTKFYTEIIKGLFQVRLSTKHEVPEDVYRLPVGIRKLRWNNSSVTFNGKQIYIRGFGRHEDSAVSGAQINLSKI